MFRCCDRSKLALSHSECAPHSSIAALSLVGDCSGSRSAGVGTQCGLGCDWRGRRKAVRAPGSLVCFLCLVPISEQHMNALHGQSLGFLQPCCKSCCFSNQLRQLIFLVLVPELRCPICGSNPHSSGRISAPVKSSFSSVSPPRATGQPIASPPVEAQSSMPFSRSYSQLMVDTGLTRYLVFAMCTSEISLDNMES